MHRRDFMKMFGISVASLWLRSCRPPLATTCYAPTPTPMPTTATRERLRHYWLRFGEVGQAAWNDSENKLGQELVANHRAALDELVASGEISGPVADLVHEAYCAGIYHAWRSSANMTCYLTMGPNYFPESAGVLLQQAAVLNQIAEGGTVQPATLEKAQAALEHDLAFYALSEAELKNLYDELSRESLETGESLPRFEELPLELTPEAEEATQFIIDLLTGQ